MCRTAAYRTEILKTDEFSQYFTEDTWLGRKLNSDDDKCLTRYVYAHGWKIALQCDSKSVIETTLEEDSKYISQCMRWARAHWRGNFTVMTNESYWRSLKYLWGTYVIYVGQFQTPALLVDSLLLALLFKVTEHSPGQVKLALPLLGSWIFLTKILKLLPHLFRHPEDVRFIPLSILFSYLHGIINIYALFTLYVTGWGSQDLHQFETARAQDQEVVPLLRHAQAEAEPYVEPTPGMLKSKHVWYGELTSMQEG